MTPPRVLGVDGTERNRRTVLALSDLDKKDDQPCDPGPGQSPHNDERTKVACAARCTLPSVSWTAKPDG